MARQEDRRTDTESLRSPSQSPRGHEQDVRATASLADGAVLTSSRDATVRVWRRGSWRRLLGGCQARGPLALRDLRARRRRACQQLERQARYRVGLTRHPLRVLEGHGNTVSAVAYSNATGCLLGLVGHPDQPRWQGVEGRQLRRDAQGTHGDDLGPARRGRAGTRSHRLGRPHVQAVVGETCVKDFGHTDAVRALALLPGVGFLSASNDGTVRMWELGAPACTPSRPTRASSTRLQCCR